MSPRRSGDADFSEIIWSESFERGLRPSRSFFILTAGAPTDSGIQLESCGMTNEERNAAQSDVPPSGGSGCLSGDAQVKENGKKVCFLLWPFVQCQRFIRFLYDWVLSWARSKFGTLALGALSFAESSFFPIPPDVLQIALSIERPKRSFYYAAVSAIASVCGAALGWYIGYALWDALGSYFVPAIISQANMDKVSAFFAKYGFWALFAAAFTPIPFKAFTISAGIASMSLPIMLAASLVGRSARFFLTAALIYVFGPGIKSWIDKYFGVLTFAFLILLIGGFYCVKFIM